MAEGGEDPENTPLHEVVTCKVCYDYMADSRTLFPCMHSFCAKCVERLNERQQEDKIGIHCPMCREFIQKDAIKPNLTINDMVNIITSIQQRQSQGGAKCVSCNIAQVNSRCLTCNIDFCKNCSKGHTQIPSCKHHNIAAIPDVGKFSLKDVVLYCNIHEEEEIKMNCKPCNQIICSKCKFEQHDNHDSESLQKAIKRYMPIIQSAIMSISQHNKSKKRNIASTKKQLAELETKQRDNERKLDTQKEKLLQKINEEYSELKDKLKMTTGAEIKKLTLHKEELEQSLVCDESVKSWAKAITENTDGAGLLREFQSGLLQKMKNLQRQDQHVNVDVNFVTFVPSDLSVVTANSMIGIVTFEQQHLRTGMPSVTRDLCQTESNSVVDVSSPLQRSLKQTVTSSYRYTSVNINTLRRFNRAKKFDLTISSMTFCLCDQSLWFPGNYIDNIKVYSSKGELLDTIELNDVFRPISLHPLGSDDQLVLAAGSGLYLLNNRGEILSQIQGGYFHDVHVQGNVMAALGRTDGEHVYLWDINDLSQPKHTFHVTLGNYINTLCLCKSYIYVCDRGNSIIHKYNLYGKHLQQYGKKGSQINGRLHQPTLCMADIKGNMLVTDCNNNKLQVLSASGQWSALGVKVYKPLDAFIADNMLYVLHGDGDDKRISKYKV